MLEARLTHADAREAYSRLAWALTAVSLYEQFATRRLIGHSRLEEAQSVFEFGCGTGHLTKLPATSVYPSDLYAASTRLWPRGLNSVPCPCLFIT